MEESLTQVVLSHITRFLVQTPVWVFVVVACLIIVAAIGMIMKGFGKLALVILIILAISSLSGNTLISKARDVQWHMQNHDYETSTVKQLK